MQHTTTIKISLRNHSQRSATEIQLISIRLSNNYHTLTAEIRTVAKSILEVGPEDAPASPKARQKALNAERANAQKLRNQGEIDPRYHKRP